MFTENNLPADGSVPKQQAGSGRGAVVFKHYQYMLKRYLPFFYVVLFFQCLNGLLSDALLSSFTRSYILNVGGAEVIYRFVFHPQTSIMLYTVASAFIVSVSMFNKEERMICYSVPCTPMVENSAKGLFLITCALLSTASAIVNYQAQRAVAYFAWRPQNILNEGFFLTAGQLFSAGAKILSWSILVMGVGYLLGALLCAKTRETLITGAAAVLFLVVAIMFIGGLAEMVLYVLYKIISFYLLETSLLVLGIKCAVTGGAAFGLGVLAARGMEVKRE